MAISHPHLILLLSLLFFLPTLRATTVPFKTCGYNSDPVTVTSVEILQDKLQTSLKISGSTSETLNTGGYMNVVIKIGVITIFSQTLDLCAHTDCPVAPGAFVLSLDKFLPSDAPAKLNIHIKAFDNSEKPLMCLTFTMPKLNVPLWSLLNQVAG